MTDSNTNHIHGLSTSEVITSRTNNGTNTTKQQQKNSILNSVLDLIKEPMFLLLLTATSIYFITSDYSNGIFMLFAILMVVSISLYQENKSKNAIATLSKLTHPKCKVIRGGKIVEILSEEIVLGDIFQTEEGTFVPADGIIIQSNDFSVNESILTGESLSIFKNELTDDKNVYQGTITVSGLAICKVTAIGAQTQLNKIGKSLDNIKEEKTPLQLQISNFVTLISLIGLVAFVIVWAINYWKSKLVLDSLLQALTLAMSIIPEEIPVAFTTFMALGAWRLLRMGIIVKQTKTVETLGSATVICTDKTGTITENKMSLAAWFTLDSNSIATTHSNVNASEQELIKTAMWASEPIPFDTMEIAIHEAYTQFFTLDERPNFKLIQEYPLSGKPPMMTHVFENKEKVRIIATKGAPEAIIACSHITPSDLAKINEAFLALTQKGFRVLGVGSTQHIENEFPKTQQEFTVDFKGLIAFYDPPKKNIKEVLQSFYKAGIAVKILTGDNAATTTTIAQMIGFKNPEKVINGSDIMLLSPHELKTKVVENNIFTRMFPEAKLKIIEALKDSNEIVAMTGDGVNDGPALKSAHIGIAMGKKGTEIAKQAANIVLVDDDLSKMVDAIAMGRKIYINLKKAIQYIISIHIPIILIVLLPLALGWKFPNIFSPVHIIFLEMIMGPTCSIIYENEPMENNLMAQKPRPIRTTFFSWKEITISLIQGLGITAGLVYIYQFSVNNQYNEATTRTLVFLTLIFSNVFLTLTNRSFYYSVLTTWNYKNNLVIGIISITLFFTSLLLFIPAMSEFFLFGKITIVQILWCFFVAIAAVFWIELFKFFKRKKEINVT